MVLPSWIGNQGDGLEGGRSVVALVCEQQPFWVDAALSMMVSAFGAVRELRTYHHTTIKSQIRKYSCIC